MAISPYSGLIGLENGGWWRWLSANRHQDAAKLKTAEGRHRHHIASTPSPHRQPTTGAMDLRSWLTGGQRPPRPSAAPAPPAAQQEQEQQQQQPDPPASAIASAAAAWDSDRQQGACREQQHCAVASQEAQDAQARCGAQHSAGVVHGPRMGKPHGDSVTAMPVPPQAASWWRCRTSWTA